MVITTVIIKKAAGLDQEMEREASASAETAGQGTGERDGIRMKAAGIEAENTTDIEMVMQTKGVIENE